MLKLVKYLQSKWPTSQDYIELHDSLHLPRHEIKVSQWKRIITGSWLWKRNVSTARKPVEERFDCAACKHANPSACRPQRIYIDGHGKLYTNTLGQRHVVSKCMQVRAAKRKASVGTSFFGWLGRRNAQNEEQTQRSDIRRLTSIDHDRCENWTCSQPFTDVVRIEKGLCHCVRVSRDGARLAHKWSITGLLSASKPCRIVQPQEEDCSQFRLFVQFPWIFMFLFPHISVWSWCVKVQPIVGAVFALLRLPLTAGFCRRQFRGELLRTVNLQKTATNGLKMLAERPLYQLHCYDGCFIMKKCVPVFLFFLDSRGKC